ncbi:MAG: hypothetical protein QW270_03330 [Candidatus Bathyarchaeia archaeon]
MKAKQKFCGNCGSHNAYNYPNEVFCSKRFCKNENPIVSTLWCCPEWNPSNQECHCIKEATKNQNKNSSQFYFSTKR